MRKSAARKKSSAPKSRSDPPLKDTQLKSVHYLFISILDSSQEDIRKMRAMCEKYYHGDGSDIAGKKNDFLNGKIRFRVMWENYNGP